MTTVHDQFVGTADEVSYGVAVAPTDFFEILTDGVSGAYERIESEAIRGPVLRADRFAPNPKGAAGDFEVEVLDKGFDFWLKHMFGNLSGTASPFTATVGSTAGKSFTYQAARNDNADTLIPFTYAGGKVTEWELSAEVDGILKCKVTCDFASEAIGAGTGAEALAVPAYPTGSQLLTFIGASVTVDGAAFPVNSISLTGNNGLKTDRYAMRGATSTTKREPKEESMKEFGFTLGAEFEDTGMSDRVANALAAGTLAEIVLHFDSPQGGALDITVPAARFDEGPVNAAREVTTQELTGKIVDDDNGIISAVYTVPA